MEKKQYKLIDNEAEQRYEYDLGDDVAVVEYTKGPHYTLLTHTGVPSKYEGQGIASALVQDVLKDLRAKKSKIIPQCSYIKIYIDRHPEWADLLWTE